MVHDSECAPLPAREEHNANRAMRVEGDPRESTLASGAPTASWPQYQGGWLGLHNTRQKHRSVRAWPRMPSNVVSGGTNAESRAE